MRFDDRFALRDSVEDFRDTVRYIVPHHVFDEQGRQRDTDDRRDEVPPCMAAGDQMVLYEPLDKVDEGFQQRCRCGRESTYEE